MADFSHMTIYNMGVVQVVQFGLQTYISRSYIMNIYKYYIKSRLSWDFEQFFWFWQYSI